MKISILYHSQTGHTKEMAEIIAEGAREVKDTQVRLFSLADVDVDYVNESDAVLFGTPTYYASTCWQLKKWFDESKNFQLAGKLGAVFATANYAQGGADIAVQTILGHMLVKGMLVFSGGSSYGQPYIHLGAVALKENFEASKPMFRVFGTRVAQKAAELFE